MSFAAYTTPHPQTNFSPAFFASITIAGAVDLVRKNQLPRILPQNSVSKRAWDPTEPIAISEIIVASDEAIPCLEDMPPITQIPGFPFHLSLIRPRWYQKQDFDVHSTAAVTYRKQTSHTIRFSATSLPAALIANPVSSNAIVNRHEKPLVPLHLLVLSGNALRTTFWLSCQWLLQVSSRYRDISMRQHSE
ncbi:hypothetical protein MSAN_02308900 [Mycena sanguinolenta]|uniref:Uncharacterized protein n=1 Tax=Mycena sanguinolenta TaxID=230812 RepID=A0A8H6X7F4_9AGAR|nr:hypothetical protein MSAN_02308900 [Mycena sanguinolenta]